MLLKWITLDGSFRSVQIKGSMPAKEEVGLRGSNSYFRDCLCYRQEGISSRPV